MLSLRYVILLAGLIALMAASPAAADAATGGNQGWYVVHSNTYDVKVYFDDKYMGTLGQGTMGQTTLTIPASTGGTPYKKIRVQKYGFSTYTADIVEIPVTGGSVDIYATLNQLPTTTTTLTGGDIGWYIVRCNVDGATVFFDDSDRGTIAQGLLYVPVYSTATPYRSYTVKKDGYSTFTGTIPSVPGKGESTDLYATLNPQQAAANGTPQVIGGDTGWFMVHSNVDGATVSFDNEPRGTIANGTLKVMIYVTGTPYRSYAVYKSGYVPFTAGIDARPGRGEIVDLNASLVPESAPSPTPTTKSPLAPEVTGAAVLLVAVGALVLSWKRE